MRAGKLAQQIRVLANKPDDLPSVSGIDELEYENQLSQIAFQSCSVC